MILSSILVPVTEEPLGFRLFVALPGSLPDTEAVLREWLRVLKPLGNLIIFCPDEQVYRKHCDATGQPYNTHHVHGDFSLDFVKRILDRIGQTEVLHETPLTDIYSWELVCRKKPDAPAEVSR